MKKKVAFLFDPTNDWLVRYLPQSVCEMENFEVDILYDRKKLKGYDIGFVLGYTMILEEEILENNGLLLVVHESDLPSGRGFAPLQWQIIEGKNDINVSLLAVAKNADEGDIVDKLLLTLEGSELYDDIRMKQAGVTYELVARFLEKYPNISYERQVGMPTFYPRRTPLDSQLDVDQTLRQQFNLLRVCNNELWPAFFEIAGVRYELKIRKIL